MENFKLIQKNNIGIMNFMYLSPKFNNYEHDIFKTAGSIIILVAWDQLSSLKYDKLGNIFAQRSFHSLNFSFTSRQMARTSTTKLNSSGVSRHPGFVCNFSKKHSGQCNFSHMSSQVTILRCQKLPCISSLLRGFYV
jgi:hypothetical protein